MMDLLKVRQHLQWGEHLEEARAAVLLARLVGPRPGWEVDGSLPLPFNQNRGDDNLRAQHELVVDGVGGQIFRLCEPHWPDDGVAVGDLLCQGHNGGGVFGVQVNEVPRQIDHLFSVVGEGPRGNAELHRRKEGGRLEPANVQLLTGTIVSAHHVRQEEGVAGEGEGESGGDQRAKAALEGPIAVPVEHSNEDRLVLGLEAGADLDGVSQPGGRLDVLGGDVVGHAAGEGGVEEGVAVVPARLAGVEFEALDAEVVLRLHQATDEPLL